MKLFTIGPTEMFETTKTMRKKDIPYFRTDSFSRDMLEMDSLLKKIMGTKVLINSKNSNSGKIEIEYYSQDELDRIIDLIRTIQ